MKKLLVVGDFMCGSGVTQFIYNIFGNFDCEKISITAVGYGKDKSELMSCLTEKRCNLFGWKLIRTPQVTKHPVKHWLFWYKLFQKKGFDIIYFNYSSSWNFLPLFFAKKMQKAKIICHSHNSYFSHQFKSKYLMFLLKRLNNIGRYFFRKYTDVRVATSKEAAVWMFGETNNVVISINGIDLKKFSFDRNKRDSIRKKYKIDANVRLIGFLGVLESRKNPLFALLVFKKLKEKIDDVKFVMIGKGSMEKKITEQIANLHLEKDVLRIPYTDKPDSWYCALDALIFPSIYEGLPLVLIEAQASNLLTSTSDLLPKQLFVTSNIFPLSIDDCDIWAVELQKRLKEKINRTELNNDLIQFDVMHQVKQIEQLI